MKESLYYIFTENLQDSIGYDFVNVDDINILSMAGCVLGYFFHTDRFDILNKYSSYNIEVPKIDGMELPKMKCEYTDIEEICNIVTEKYIKLAKQQNKKIFIFWSGGVDSTCILVSFLKNKNLNLSNFYVLLTNKSIEENWDFYHNFIHNKIQCFLYDVYNYVDTINRCIFMFNEEIIFISGQTGDQLFGSAINKKHTEYYFEPWEDVLYTLYKNAKESKQYIKFYNFNFDVDKCWESHVEIYKKYFDTLGFDVKLFCEFSWLLNFAIKWNYVRHDHPIQTGNNYMIDNYYAFYSDILFQEWSCHNFPNIKKNHIYRDSDKYKLELKKIIYDFDKNENYLLHKSKEGSHAVEPSRDYRNTISIYDKNGYMQHIFDIKNDTITVRNFYDIKKVLNKYSK